MNWLTRWRHRRLRSRQRAAFVLDEVTAQSRTRERRRDASRHNAGRAWTMIPADPAVTWNAPTLHLDSGPLLTRGQAARSAAALSRTRPTPGEPPRGRSTDAARRLDRP
jgi:hypothetical protein